MEYGLKDSSLRGYQYVTVIALICRCACIKIGQSDVDLSPHILDKFHNANYSRVVCAWELVLIFVFLVIISNRGKISQFKETKLFFSSK